jgi:hypothetical protein
MWWRLLQGQPLEEFQKLDLAWRSLIPLEELKVRQLLPGERQASEELLVLVEPASPA